MIVFIIPVKSKKVATSWPDLCQLFDRSLRDDSSPETMLEDYQADIDRYVITQGGS
ncbi:hypothetical protein [Planktothrix agardhii]|uniref:hypothetical protein n=1 Tax=Planktothrix agardhii TaxID=1160 RepID=UPI000423A8E2|nr:hypothetical protein [Planktothrix agardhii]CAD5978417.1 hypothetical protein NO758_04323 [Planktothrix agardhii]